MGAMAQACGTGIPRDHAYSGDCVGISTAYRSRRQFPIMYLMQQMGVPPPPAGAWTGPTLSNFRLIFLILRVKLSTMMRQVNDPGNIVGGGVARKQKSVLRSWSKFKPGKRQERSPALRSSRYTREAWLEDLECLGMSQAKFSRITEIPVGQLHNWGRWNEKIGRHSYIPRWLPSYMDMLFAFKTGAVVAEAERLGFVKMPSVAELEGIWHAHDELVLMRPKVERLTEEFQQLRKEVELFREELVRQGSVVFRPPAKSKSAQDRLAEVKESYDERPVRGLGPIVPKVSRGGGQGDPPRGERGSPEEEASGGTG